MFPFHDILAETVQGGGHREREKSKRASTKSSQTLQQLLPHAGLTERKMVTQRNTQEPKGIGMPTYRHCPYVQKSANMYPWGPTEL